MCFVNALVSFLLHLRIKIWYDFQVITTDAVVDSDVWRKMVQVAVSRSFNQITVSYDIVFNVWPSLLLQSGEIEQLFIE